MKNKFKILPFLFGLLALITLFACEGNSPEATDELTIGLMPSLDSFPVVLADYFGYFEDEGVTVNIEAFSSAADRDAAMQAGELNGATFDLVAVGLYIEAGFPIRVTGNTTGRFTLVAQDGITHISDLAGHDVVISEHTAIDFMLDEMVRAEGYETNYLNRVILGPIPGRMELLREGQASAALLPEPWATMAIMDGFVNITDTVELGMNPFVIAFSDETINELPEAIRAFYRAYNRAVDYINSNDLTDYFHIIVEEIGFSEQVADHLLLPTFTHNTLPSSDVLTAAINWLRSRDLISESITPDDLIHHVAFE